MPPLYARLRHNLNPHLFAGIAVTAAFIPLTKQLLHPYIADLVPFILNTMLLFLTAIYLYLSVQVPWDIYLYASEKATIHQDTVPLKSTHQTPTLPSTPQVPAVTASASCSFHASFTLSPPKRYAQYLARLAFFGTLACPLLSALVLEAVRHRILDRNWVQYLDPILFVMIAMTRPLLHLARSIQLSTSDAGRFALKTHKVPMQHCDPILHPVELGSPQSSKHRNSSLNAQSTNRLPLYQSLVQLKETRTYLAAYLNEVDSILTKIQHTQKSQHLSTATKPVVGNKRWRVFPVYRLGIIQSIKTWPSVLSVLATCLAWLILRCLRSFVECLVMPFWVWSTGVRVVWYFVTWIPRHVLEVPLRQKLRTSSNNKTLLPASPSS